MDISLVDKNFKIETNISRPGLSFVSALDSRFSLHGVFHDGERFLRLPREVAERTSAGVAALNGHTAGGRIRFVTDSPYVVIKAFIPEPAIMMHMAYTGQAGIDVYLKKGGVEKYRASIIPAYKSEPNLSYEGALDLGEGEKELTLNMPLYQCVSQIYIGLSEGSVTRPAPKYRVDKPIVYYGSSITQGGCASRPGMSYQAILSRMLDADHINLGFSGNAHGELTMAEYIGTLDMSVFVLDYDHNAPTPERLQRTHKPFFDAFRRLQPNTPVLMLGAPNEIANREERYQIIKNTFDCAGASADQNVYFIDGRELMSICGQDGTVDGCHPTDLGFFMMAERIYPVLNKILKNYK